MMEEIYWIDIIEKLDVVIIIAAAGLGFIGLASIVCAGKNDWSRREYRLGAFRLLAGAIVCLFLTLAIPSRKDLYKMYGISGVIDAVKKEKPVDAKYIKAMDNWLRLESRDGRR
jgi:hypothetical protein